MMRARLALVLAAGLLGAAEPAPSDRGRYLVLHVATCFSCHSTIDWKAEGFPPREGAAGAGRAPFSEATPWLTAPNLTSDRETGAGRWSDEQIERAIRRGIGADERLLHPAMPSAAYHAMSDDDVAAVVAYLRTLRPVRNPLPSTRLPEEIRSRLRPLPPTSTRGAPENRGEYLVTIAGCGRCHTPSDEHGAALAGMAFAGGVRLKGPWGDLHSPNLTPDASGIECLGEKDFVRAMKTGEMPGHTLNAVMPWGSYRGLSDEDLAAIFSYLRALRPVRHFVDNGIAPTPCRKCGTPHGLGDKNR
ncbi:MAG TPA: c-type cytochrome [Planctomycetota bacterium]|jgi:mono/diheme cytochrome c family protein|nr:c-type cytochrome [Planctomycetota bacterium]